MSVNNNELETLYAEMTRSIVDGKEERAVELASQAIERGLPLLDVIERGFTAGIVEVGRLWEEGEYFLPELMRAAEIMKAAMAVLLPELARNGNAASQGGKVVIGTVAGDIHDIGKTIVATLLSANGLDVEDMGADVPHDAFVRKVKEGNVGVLCLSALLTTTMAGQKTVIEALEKEGVRDTVKVVVGGAPVTSAWAKEIGADGYGENAISAVSVVKGLLGR